MRKIVCGKYDCEFNCSGKCVKKEIGIDNNLKCIVYNRKSWYPKSQVFKEFEEQESNANIC